MTLEIAIDSWPDALAAVAAGADRLEVCSRLDLGGLTPPNDLVRDLARETSVPLFVMIRPREGDFVYSMDELTEMERQIAAAKSAGAHGLVLGVLTQAGEMDIDRIGALVRKASPLPVTVHRAFDRCRDLEETAAQLVFVGVTRILTSGGSETAESGIETLRRLQRSVGTKIGILPGGGVRPGNIGRLVREIGVSEIHSAARDQRGRFDAGLVKEMVRVLRGEEGAGTTPDEAYHAGL